MFVVTTAVKLPAVAGLVEKVTVSDVAVAAVTVPAPSLKTTVLLSAVVSKPKPLIVTVVALTAKLVIALVTTGVMVATLTAEPLLTPLVVTIAVISPAVAGLVENVTVRLVADAAVTIPAAPSSKTTVLLLGVALKPKPAIVTVDALAARLAVARVTTGLTVAT